MLTEVNFKTMVGFQECTHFDTGKFHNTGLAFLMGVTYENPKDWTDDIRTMSNDEVLDKMIDDNPRAMMSFSIIKTPVVCNQTFDEVLATASEYLLSLPTFSSTLPSPFYKTAAASKIAFFSRRGAGNAQIDNIMVYRGTNEFDCCMSIVKCGDLYGIAKQQYFDRYGFVLDGTKI